MKFTVSLMAALWMSACAPQGFGALDGRDLAAFTNDRLAICNQQFAAPRTQLLTGGVVEMTGFYRLNRDDRTLITELGRMTVRFDRSASEPTLPGEDRIVIEDEAIVFSDVTGFTASDEASVGLDVTLDERASTGAVGTARPADGFVVPPSILMQLTGTRMQNAPSDGFTQDFTLQFTGQFLRPTGADVSPLTVCGNILPVRGPQIGAFYLEEVSAL